MSEKLKTIKELADELGVSKSYIDKDSTNIALTANCKSKLASQAHLI